MTNGNGEVQIPSNLIKKNNLYVEIEGKKVLGDVQGASIIIQEDTNVEVKKISWLWLLLFVPLLLLYMLYRSKRGLKEEA